MGYDLQRTLQVYSRNGEWQDDTVKKIGTQWVHVSTAVTESWLDVGQKFASLTSWLLSANCRVAVRPQMYRESRVLYELIFVAFD